ncbi:hypothetical protein GCM10022239_10020 [Leifsonia bigeumensis]|uniref:Integral membrane protein n=1 Tax=Leifsonella bigeumensis TaxID=433643 RepID=A0ABP7FCH3_9MICO
MRIEDGTPTEPGPAWPATGSGGTPLPDAALPYAALPYAALPVTEPLPPESPVTPPTPHTPWPLGYIAFGMAVLLVVAEGVAVYLATYGQPVAATVIGQVLVVLTALPLALGLLAVLRGRQRGWGIAAMVLAVIANPLILINLLGFFGTI